MSGSVILITGSSRGIGEAIARQASVEGNKVILHGKSDSKSLRLLAKTLKAEYITADITNKNEVEIAIKKAINYYGKIDVLVNNSGIVRPASVLDTNEEEWLNHFKTNTMGLINVVQAIYPQMQKQMNASIVNISSMHGHDYLASDGVAAYSASKAAVLNITVSLARELAPHIRVNAVSPGFTLTDMSKTWPDRVWAETKKTLAGRAANPQEIANVVLFLASNKSSYITGQTLLVDGGYSVSLGKLPGA